MESHSGEVQSWGLTEIQALVLSIILNPALCIKQFGSISRRNIAKYLGRTIDDVSQAFDKNLVDTVYETCMADLIASKKQVDEALIASASQANGYGAADRKLFYTLINAMDRVGDDGTGDKKVSREEMVESLLKYLPKVSKTKIRRDLFNGHRSPTPSEPDPKRLRGPDPEESSETTGA